MNRELIEAIQNESEDGLLVFMIPVEIEQEKIAALIREVGYDPTEKRIQAVCDHAHCNDFNQKYAGCHVDNVEDYIVSTMSNVVDDFVRNSGFDEEEEQEEEEEEEDEEAEFTPEDYDRWGVIDESDCVCEKEEQPKEQWSTEQEQKPEGEHAHDLRRV